MEKITEESVAQPCCALRRWRGVSRGVSLNWRLCRGESELKAAWCQGQSHMKAGKGNIHQGARKGRREKACLQGHPELPVGGSTVSWEPWRHSTLERASPLWVKHPRPPNYVQLAPFRWTWRGMETGLQEGTYLFHYRGFVTKLPQWHFGQLLAWQKKTGTRNTISSDSSQQCADQVWLLELNPGTHMVTELIPTSCPLMSTCTPTVCAPSPYTK